MVETAIATVIGLALTVFALLFIRHKSKQRTNPLPRHDGDELAPTPSAEMNSGAATPEDVCDRDPVDFIVFPDGNVLYFKGAQEDDGALAPTVCVNPELIPDAEPPDLKLSDIDPSDRDQMRRWEAQQLRKGLEGLKAEHQRLLELGFIDEEGNRLSEDLPDDMKPGSDAEDLS